MKKLGIILTAAVVLFAFAIPAFAAEDTDKGAIGFSNMYADVSLAVDDYNTVLFELAGSKVFTQSVIASIDPTAADPADMVTMGAIFSVPYFQLETDVGGALGLPIDLTNTAGLTSLWSRKYEVTAVGHRSSCMEVRGWNRYGNRHFRTRLR